MNFALNRGFCDGRDWFPDNVPILRSLSNFSSKNQAPLNRRLKNIGCKQWENAFIDYSMWRVQSQG